MRNAEDINMYIVIGGAGEVGRRLIQQLQKGHYDVVVIDHDPRVCEEMYVSMGVETICGHCADIEMLEDAGIEKADVAVALTRSDVDNLAFSLLAKNFKVPLVLSRMSNPKYEIAYRMAGVDRILSVVDLFVQQIMLDIELPELKRVAIFGGGRATVVLVAIPPNSACAGKSVAQIGKDPGFPINCVIAGIYREAENEFIVPRGDAVIKGGDELFLVAPADAIRKAAKFLR